MMFTIELTQEQAIFVYERVKAAQPDQRDPNNPGTFDLAESIMTMMEEIDPGLS